VDGVQGSTTVTVNNVAPLFIEPDYGTVLINVYDYPLGGPYVNVLANP
jgi:hypothetical protein